MPSFGHYETVSELHRSGFSVIYRAHPATGGKDDFAIKVFEPIALLTGVEQAKSEAELFRSSAGTQQLVQAEGGAHWAPIHQCDSTDAGAFYVTDYYDRSLQQLIDGHARPSAGILHKIVESVALGLVELKQTCNRPHGNLKATNVLIAAEEKIAAPKIVLSDPSPDKRIKKYQWADDLRAIGELIYQLIMHRPAPATHGWKVSETDEWKTLGRQAKHWMDLCNRLLSAPAKPDAITLEGLVEELAGLKKLRSAYLRRWIIAAGLLVAAGIAVYLVYGYITRKPPSEADWDKACIEYIAWVEALESQVKKSNWQQKDPHFKTIIKKIEVAAYPREVAYKKDSDVATEKDHPENAATGKTADAIEAINDIKRYLKPSSADNPEGWPLLGKVDELAHKLEDYGPSELSSSLQALIDSVQPPENKPDAEDDDIKKNSKIADNIDTILLSQDIIEDIYACIDELDKNKATIEAAGEPFTTCAGSIESELSNLAEAAKDTDIRYDEEDNTLHINTQKLNTLSQDSQELKNKVDELAACLAVPEKDNFHKELFVNEFKDLNLTEKSPLEKWLPAVKDYRRITDPRRESEWPDIHNRLDEDIKRLEQDPQFAAKGEQFRKTLAQVESRFEQFPKALENEGLYFIVRDKTVIEQKLDDLLSKLHDFQQEVSIEVAKLVPPGEWLVRQLQLEFTESQILQETWSRIRTNILPADVQAKLQQDDQDQLQKVRPDVEQLWSRLQKIDNKRKELDRKFDDLPIPVNRSIDLKSELANAYKLAREKVFHRIISQFPPGKVPDMAQNRTDDPDAFTPQWHDELNTFDSRGDDLAGLTKKFYELNKSFAHCRLLDDDSVRESSDEFIGLNNELKGRSELAGIFIDTSPIQSRFQGLISRIGKLKEIAASNDRTYLAQTAGNPGSQTEAIYTAWKGLGEIKAPPWPRPDEAAAEEQIRDILVSRFGDISDAGRKNELINELSSVGKTRQKIVGTAIADNLTARLKDNLNRVKSQVISCKAFDAFVEYAETNMKQYNTDLSALETETSTLQTLKSRLDGSINELKALADSANLLAGFLQNAEWNDDSNYRRDLFVKAIDETPPAQSLTPLEWANAIQEWKDEFVKYRVLDDDPRDNITDADVDNLGKKIEAEKDADKRNTLKGKLAVLAKDLENSRQTYPAIELYKEMIINDFTQFEQRRRTIRNSLKPLFCEYIELSNGQVHFIGEYKSLQKSFQPVLALDFEPAQPSDFRPLNEEDWDNLKDRDESLKDESLAKKFFHKFNPETKLWPSYVRSAKDSSVIFRFIPHDKQPFYMAIHEITNLQFIRFLKENTTRVSGSGSKVEGNVKFGDDNFWFIIIKVYKKNKHIVDNYGVTHYGIYRDGKSGNFELGQLYGDWQTRRKSNTPKIMQSSQSENAPATYVTPYGAKSYAEWLGAGLPTAQQHIYACKAGTSTIYPWEQSHDGQLEKHLYANLIGSGWKNAVDRFNADLPDMGLMSTPDDYPFPMGALQPSPFRLGHEPLLTDNQFFLDGTEQQAWPYDTSATNIRPNKFGLYDMVGNVWEWCVSDDSEKDPVICGFSCLTPKSVLKEDTYVFDRRKIVSDGKMKYRFKPNGRGSDSDPYRARDIGFRVIFLPAEK